MKKKEEGRKKEEGKRNCAKKRRNIEDRWMVWFGFFVLMAYQLFLGYLMPKPFS